MLQLISGPAQDGYYTKSHLPSLEVYSDRDFVLGVYYREDTLFVGSYACHYNHIFIDIKDIISEFLSHTLRFGESSVLQEDFWKSFNVWIHNDTEELDFYFYVLNINSRISSLSAISKSFLTFQPDVKYITRQSPEYLSYYFTVQDSKMIVRFYYNDGSNETITLFDFSNEVAIHKECVMQDVSCEYVWSLSNRPSSQRKMYYDVFVVDAKGHAITTKQRYVVGDETGREKYFIFCNALGGIDTLIFGGQNSAKPSVEYNIGSFNDVLQQLDDSDDFIEYTQNTGYFSREMFRQIVDFAMSKTPKFIFNPDEQTYKRIVMTDSDPDINDRESFSSFTFKYRIAEQDYLELENKVVEAQELIVASKVSKEITYETGSRNIEVTYDSAKNSYDTDVMECTASGGMSIQVATNGTVSVYTSTDKKTWSLVETVFVEGSTIRPYDYAPEGSYWKVESTGKITMIKMFI